MFKNELKDFIFIEDSGILPPFMIVSSVFDPAIAFDWNVLIICLRTGVSF
jgi:hypothetical protein